MPPPSQLSASLTSPVLFVRLNDRYTSGFLERLCGQHVESVFGYALAQYDKELRSTEERERLYEMLGVIKDTAVEKASGAVSIASPELRAAIVSRVNATRTVVWGDSVDVSEAANKDSAEERQDQEWLIFWTFYANVPVDGTLYFERWHSALRYTLEWRSPLKHVLLQRLRGICLDRLVQYDPAANAVVLCPSCLSAPFFYGRAQNSVLYGGLGYLYARALASGVDYAPPFWSVTANATSSQIAESVTASVVVKRFRRNAPPFPKENVPHGSNTSTLKAASIDNTKVISNGLPSTSISPARRVREEDGTPWSATPVSSTAKSIPPLNQTSVVVASSTPVMPVRAQRFATEAGAEVFTSIANQASMDQTQTDICKSSTLSPARVSLRRVKRGARHYVTSGRSSSSTKEPSRLEAAWPPRSGGAHGLSEDGGLSSGPKLPAVTPGGATSARVSRLSVTSALQEEGPCSSEAADVSFLDVAALDIAYEAFAKLLSRGENVRLKDLPEFTTEQIFFLTACHTRCERVLRPEIRVCNDAALNVGAFAKAFSCPAGTFMNPAVRCPFTWPRSSTLGQ
ncbi:hypothetical protein HPB49_015815 [Dermacentor silvarum]|uniref:Uncharacterized protein n=1 Tax=Dermacentor silvarum TaxID=543639 RepID=A0ACB8DK44_DERSI|nr:hypothetical protein HPB49_015815 [Dermacentor silvarum]